MSGEVGMPASPLGVSAGLIGVQATSEHATSDTFNIRAATATDAVESLGSGT